MSAGKVVPLKKSGTFKDPDNRTILVTQGLRDSTLVAGKQTLFRVFTSNNEMARWKSVELTIDGIGGAASSAGIHEIVKFSPRSSLRLSPQGAYLRKDRGAIHGGLGVSLILRGRLFSHEGGYGIRFVLKDAQRNAFVDTDFTVEFSRAHDLRILVVPSFWPNWDNKIYPPDPVATKAIVRRAMDLLGARLPVRDGVSDTLSLDPNLGPNANARCFGLRYYYADPLMVAGRGHSGIAQWSPDLSRFTNLAKTINETADVINGNGPMSPVDRVDAILNYMLLPPDPETGFDDKEVMGSTDYLSFSNQVTGASENISLAWVTGNRALSTSIILHEMGHSLGLEPGDSPYLNLDNGEHAKPYRGDKPPFPEGGDRGQRDPDDHTDPDAFDHLNLSYMYNFYCEEKAPLVEVNSMGKPLTDKAHCFPQPDATLLTSEVEDIMAEGARTSGERWVYNWYAWNVARTNIIDYEKKGVTNHASGSEINPDCNIDFMFQPPNRSVISVRGAKRRTTPGA